MRDICINERLARRRARTVIAVLNQLTRHQGSAHVSVFNSGQDEATGDIAIYLERSGLTFVRKSLIGDELFYALVAAQMSDPYGGG